MACMTMRTAIWITWAFHAFASAVYLGLAVNTGNNIGKATDNIRGGSNEVAYKNGLMASVVLGFIINFFFIIFSPIILVGKRFGAELKFCYGMMLGSCLTSAWFMLLAGLVLNASQGLAKSLNSVGVWSYTDYSAYSATFAFSYILACTYVLLFIVLFLGRNSMATQDQYVDKGGSKSVQLPPAASSRFAGSNV